MVNLHYMLSKTVVKARPSVLWCYKTDLYLSSHKKKRMRQIKKMAQRGLLGGCWLLGGGWRGGCWRGMLGGCWVGAAASGRSCCLPAGRAVAAWHDCGCGRGR